VPGLNLRTLRTPPNAWADLARYAAALSLALARAVLPEIFWRGIFEAVEFGNLNDLIIYNKAALLYSFSPIKFKKWILFISHKNY
jgi:hypothetical protein